MFWQAPSSGSNELCIPRCSRARAYALLLHYVPVLGWLPRYPVRDWLLGDLLSGLSVAIMQLPQGELPSAAWTAGLVVCEMFNQEPRPLLLEQWPLNPGFGSPYLFETLLSKSALHRSTCRLSLRAPGGIASYVWPVQFFLPRLRLFPIWYLSTHLCG